MSELSRETSALLDEGRHGESLGAAHKARLKRAVLAQAVTASVVTTTSAAAAWTSGTVAKVVAVVAVVSAVGSVAGGAAFLASSRARDERAPVAQVARAVAPTVVAARSIAAAPAVPATSVPAQPMAQRLAPAAEARRLPVRTTLPVAEEPEPYGASIASIAVHAPPLLEEQTTLLKEADDALKLGQADRALQLLDTFAARFPDSPLAPERAAERVFALCMAGRTDDARQAAAAFFRVQPEGPLASRVRASCGGAQ